MWAMGHRRGSQHRADHGIKTSCNPDTASGVQTMMDNDFTHAAGSTMYCKLGYFHFGNISPKMLTRPFILGQFHDKTLVSLIKSDGFYFYAGNFSR